MNQDLHVNKQQKNYTDENDSNCNFSYKIENNQESIINKENIKNNYQGNIQELNNKTFKQNDNLINNNFINPNNNKNKKVLDLNDKDNNTNNKINSHSFTKENNENSQLHVGGGDSQLKNENNNSKLLNENENLQLHNGNGNSNENLNFPIYNGNENDNSQLQNEKENFKIHYGNENSELPNNDNLNPDLINKDSISSNKEEIINSKNKKQEKILFSNDNHQSEEKIIFSNNNNEEEKKEQNISQEENKKIIKDQAENSDIDRNKKEVYTAKEKIRTKIMDRIKKGRASSCDKKNENDTKSQNILMKAKLLEKVLGNMKSPEDFNNCSMNNNNRNVSADRGSLNQKENIPVVKKKKKKKNNIPFDG